MKRRHDRLMATIVFICESPIDMGNDGLAAPGITHRHPPAARLCRGGVSFGTLESRPPVGTPRRQRANLTGVNSSSDFLQLCSPRLDDEERFVGGFVLRILLGR